MLNTTTPGQDESWLTLAQLSPLLLTDGVVTAAQINSLTTGPEDVQPRHPLVRIAEQNWRSARDPHQALDIEWLCRWLANRSVLKYVRIDPLRIDIMQVTRVVSFAYAKRFRILPIEVTPERITIASAEPFAVEWNAELSGLLRKQITHVFCNPLAVERYLKDFYSVSQSLSGATAAAAAEPVLRITNLEQLVTVAETDGEPSADDRHVVRLVDWLLQFAFEQRASDIHLEPRREQGNVRFRIDGVMHLVHHVQTVVLNAMISRLKTLGRMDIVERRRPQDGRVKTKPPNGHEIELRLSTMPTTFGEKLVMRIFDPEVLVRSINELGLVGPELARWRELTEAPSGMLVVTGPTGSGKTTTLYSALRQLARPELNVCTIEDPIEMVDGALNQMAVQPAIGVDFASGIRTLMRQDPDIIMVGEIRDKETASAALQAAMTGHLVLTTLHTNDAPSSITRLLDLGVPPFLLRAALLGIVAQRLVRTLCPHCKFSEPLNSTEWKALTAPHKARAPRQVYKALGCNECRHTGFKGRIGIFEMMPMSKALRGLMHEATDAEALRAQAVSEGMRSLRLSGALKVYGGITTASEVFAVTPPATDS